MTEYELLALSAVAAGYTLTNCREFMCRDGVEWNPLTDDGDALRLATDLELNVFHAVAACYAMTADSEIEASVSYRDVGCNHRATRLAIVRVAAEIGRSMT